MKQRPTLMEYLWIIIAVVSAIFFIDAMIRFGWVKAKTFLVFVFISLIMYLWRRTIRKQQE